MSHGLEACVLCGSETADRVMATVEWIEPIGKERWSHVPRCVDRAACRRTVELALKEPWPIADRTPAPEPVVPVEEPPPVAAPGETPQPDVEEEISWLR